MAGKIEIIEKELKECKEELEFYKGLNEMKDKCETSIQDSTFKKTDDLLSEKYFALRESLLEKKLNKFRRFDRELQNKRLLVNNSIDVIIPPIDNLDELKDFWQRKDQKEKIELIHEYLKLITFSHHFKIKQLINSLFSLINNRRLLSTVLICRALFEHVSVLNSYYELYRILVREKRSSQIFHKKDKGKVIKGDLSESFKAPFEKLKERYKEMEIEFIFCLLCHRYLLAGRNDLRLYEKHGNDWRSVFKAKEKLEYDDKVLELASVRMDIEFLENKINYAQKWYHVLCEFVHPNAGSHRTVIFKRINCVKKNGKDIELDAFESLGEENKERLRKEMNVVSKYKLSSISSYDVKQNYAFIIEASYYPLIRLISLSIEIIKDLLRGLKEAAI